MTKKEEIAKEKADAIKMLRSLARKSNYVFYTKLDHVSRSGMFRRISVYAMEGNKPQCVNFLIEKLGVYKRTHGSDSLGISGCGMDMGFAIVYNTSCHVFPTYKCRGEATKKRRSCPASIHVNEHTPRDKTAIHKDGYCISQKWF